ncbi:MAG: helix-turn-helix domain-containing protein, partial [Chitinophagaceae bacterium]|nr:helix-turn-helix domain-containing protein [Chitinophagaceae bacterium]
KQSMELSYFDKVNNGRFFLYEGTAIPTRAYAGAKKQEPFYTILFNQGAPTKIFIDSLAYDLPPHAIVPIMFNQVYQLPEPDGLVMWQFNREFYCIVNHDKEVGCAGFLFYGSWGQMILQTNASMQKRLLLLLEVFRDEFEEKDDIQGNMLRMLLVRLIISITRIAREQYMPHGDESDVKFDLLRKFNLLVESHYRTQHEVQYYAATLYKSPKTLANTFAKFNMGSPLQLIHARIMLEAKRLLNFTEKTMKEIANDLGFEDAAHFTKFFKNHSGLSPSEFRKSLKV